MLFVGLFNFNKWFTTTIMWSKSHSFYLHSFDLILFKNTIHLTKVLKRYKTRSSKLPQYLLFRPQTVQ